MITRLLAPLLLLLSACATVPPTQPSASGVPGAISSADPRATEAGLELLRQGGSATDAAAGVMLALTVVEPQSSGIGGGGFLVLHDEAADRITTYNGRERAPMAATPAYFLDASGQPRSASDAVPGGLSVGVPGNLRLIDQAHGRHGRLTWAQLFQPAIRLARDGFAISPRMHAFLSSEGALARLSAWGRTQFYQADGQPKPAGTVLRNPELAALLERIAARGPDSFYVGPDAQALVQTVRGAERNPSQMTVGDLAAYESQERPAVCADYRRHRICGMGPPSSGGTTVYAILKQLERFDLARMGPQSPEAWHLFGESMRLAYADRDAFIGDPDFVQVPVDGLVDPAYLARRSTLLSPDRTMATVAAGTPFGAAPRTPAVAGEVPSTSHFVAVDRAGNVASYTSTIEGVWGSGLTVNGHFLNNELTDFSFVAERDGAPVANRVEGGKRPRSSMAPTIVYGPDGEVLLAVGAAGGPTIIAQVAKAIMAVVDWKLSAQEALALPNMYLRGDGLVVESGTFLEALLPELRRRGARVESGSAGSKLNAVGRAGPSWSGAADPRSEGRAASE